jgi:PAS domain S-box-containing protein
MRHLPQPKPTIQKVRRSNFLPFLILALGLCFTFAVSFYFSEMADLQDQTRFRKSVQEINDKIKARIQTSIALLRAATGLFAASDEVRAVEFNRFVEQIELNKNYPGIQGIGFSIRFNAKDKVSVEAAVRRAGYHDFKVWSQKPPVGDEYHAIVYLQPLDDRNRRALGYDMFTDDVRRQAMEQARDTGLPTASGKVVLVQETEEGKQSGFLIYAPVYRNDMPTGTLDERRKALLGFVYSPFRAEDFLAPVISDESSNVSFKVYDGTEAKPESLLFASRPDSATTNRIQFVGETNDPVAERPWTIAYSTNPSFDLNSSRAFLPYIFAAGAFLSWLFFALTRAEVRARAAAERSALELQTSEATIRKTLAEREFAEDKLRESEESYRELVENANDIVFTLDFQGRITSVNKAAETITEYSQAELLDRDIADILTPESVVAAQQMLGNQASAAERANYELDIVSRTGKIITLEVSSKLIFKNSTAAGIQGIARDISSRRRAEEALREADQRALSEYERLLERISVLAQALGAAREPSAVFRGLKDFTKISIPCDGFFVSLYDAERDVRTACYAWGDGEELDVSELPPMPVITSGGPNSRAVRTGQIIITDDYMNATRGQASVIVGPDNGLRPQSSIAVPMAVTARILGTIEVQSYQRAAYRQEHATAMSMAANLTAVAIENVRLLKRESDARESAEESNRLKDEFLATVSHELRTPLTAILGWARLLESGSLDDEISKQAVETIWRNAKAQAQIVDDILDVSRIITGNLYLDLQPLQVVPVVEAAINVVRPTADAKGIRIDAELDSIPVVVLGDANRLQQVIWNLLSNAVKFTNSGGRVLVKLGQVGAAVEISVRDSGQGISRDFLPYVFDRFRQADSTTTRQHGGLGLGLAIARHLVEIHGGTIKAESSGEGNGSTFTIQLPLVDSSVKEAKPDVTKNVSASRASKAPQLLSGVRVLVVDDDADTLQLMTTALTSRQATVTAVSSAGEAIEAIKTSRPDVLVSDIAMPDEDGYGLIRRIRSLEDHSSAVIPAVAITAYAKEEDKHKALSSGYQIYLAKPIELTELVSVVAKAARREF